MVLLASSNGIFVSRNDFGERKLSCSKGWKGLGLCFRGLYIHPPVGSTCCNVTRASLTTVVAFCASISLLLPKVIIVTVIVVGVIGSVSSRVRGETQIEVDNDLTQS